MKKNLQEKIISTVIGITIGIAITYGYTYYTTSSTKQSSTIGGANSRNFDPANMSDQQLTNMATRAGISKDELKKRLDAGENIRDIMSSSTTRGFGNRSGSGARVGSGQIAN